MSVSKGKICFITAEFYPKIGGLAKAATRLVRFLVEAGYEVHVVMDHSKNDPQTYKFENGYHFHRLGVKKESLYSGHMRHFIRELDGVHHFDLFHAFWFDLAFPTAFFVEKSGRPFIASIRGSDAYKWANPALGEVSRFIFESLTCLTSVNSHLLKIVADHGYQGRTAVIRNSIHMPEVDEWNLERCRRGLVGTVATFRPVKDIPTLLKAYHGLPVSTRQGLRLVGFFESQHAQEEQKVMELITELQLAEEVSITGRQELDEVYAHLGELHVFVMTSKTEGFPNALLEAASIGVPVVVTNFSGIGDYIVDGENALVVPVGDSQAISHAIARIMDDDDLARKLSAGSLALSQKFRPEIEKAEWLELYEAVLG